MIFISGMTEDGLYLITFLEGGGSVDIVARVWLVKRGEIFYVVGVVGDLDATEGCADLVYARFLLLLRTGAVL